MNVLEGQMTKWVSGYMGVNKQKNEMGQRESRIDSNGIFKWYVYK